MKRSIFYTGPFLEGLRPHLFLRFLSDFHYKKSMTSSGGKVYNTKFGKKLKKEGLV